MQIKFKLDLFKVLIVIMFAISLWIAYMQMRISAQMVLLKTFEIKAQQSKTLPYGG